MSEQTKECIEKLYYTRALLSEISQMGDDIKKLDLEVVEDQDFEVYYSNHQADKIELVKVKREKLEQHKGEVDDIQQKIVQKTEAINKIEKEYLEPTPVSVIIGLTIFSILVLGLLIIWWVNARTRAWLPGTLTVLGGILFAFMEIGLICTSSTNYVKEGEKKKADAYFEKESLIGQKKEKEVEIAKYLTEITELEDFKKSEKNYYQKTLSDRKERLNNKRKELVHNSTSLYEVTKEQALIDERDWKHLDIIIYELETGRADTIKEALQQTDLYVRHNEVTDVIKQATLAVCHTIQDSVGYLTGTISAQISELNENMSALNSSQMAIGRSLGELVNAQELSNALLKKANVSSEQLANDVNRLRRISDEAYYKG